MSSRKRLRGGSFAKVHSHRTNFGSNGHLTAACSRRALRPSEARLLSLSVQSIPKNTPVFDNLWKHETECGGNRQTPYIVFIKTTKALPLSLCGDGRNVSLVNGGTILVHVLAHRAPGDRGRDGVAGKSRRILLFGPSRLNRPTIWSLGAEGCAATSRWFAEPLFECSCRFSSMNGTVHGHCG